MSRKKETISNEIPELNLGPIMNMVVILIPLLLLSVVFTEVGVINITAPKLAMGAATEKPDEEKEPLNLTITIEDKGLLVAYRGSVVPAIGGCNPDGPTICLKDNTADAAQAFQAAIAKLKGGDAAKKEGSEEMKKVLNMYNWRELYNQLSIIKDQFPDETVINITAEPTIPYSMVVRTMDASRYRLEKKSYSSDRDYWTAPFAKEGDSYAPLFPDPVLNLAK